MYRDLLDMNCPTTRKCAKGRKKGTQVCRRVVTLCKNLAAFGQKLGTQLYPDIFQLGYYYNLKWM